jgi:hypothetical protein
MAHATKPEPVPHPWHINCYHAKGEPAIEPEKQVLSIREGDQAQWGSTEEVEFTVAFKGRSPFKATVFHVPAGGTVCSGPITGKPGIYEYSLIDYQGKVKDPTIIVEN